MISPLVLVSENLNVLSTVKVFYGMVFLTVAYREMHISEINELFFIFLDCNYLFKIEKGE